MPRAVFASLVLMIAVPASVQEPKPADPAPAQLTAAQDHKLMMNALGISSLREGANGMNRNAPNAANYDESKANLYPNLPDPLTLKNGAKVTTPEQWWRAPARDRRGFRPRGLRTRPARRPQGKVGSHEHDPGEGRRDSGHHPATGGPRRQFPVPPDQGRDPALADEAGGGHGSSAGDDGVRVRGIRPPAGRAAGERDHAKGGGCVPEEGDAEERFRRGPRCWRAVLAAAGPCQGVGLRHHRPQQHPGRQRRRAHQGDHRPVQQGAAAQAR